MGARFTRLLLASVLGMALLAYSPAANAVNFGGGFGGGPPGFGFVRAELFFLTIFVDFFGTPAEIAAIDQLDESFGITPVSLTRFRF